MPVLSNIKNQNYLAISKFQSKLRVFKINALQEENMLKHVKLHQRTQTNTLEADFSNNLYCSTQNGDKKLANRN